jgi:hypothetical protein
MKAPFGMAFVSPCPINTSAGVAMPRHAHKPIPDNADQSRRPMKRAAKK